MADLEVGAKRETLEEANARVTIDRLLTVYSIPHINQVYLLFLAQLDDLDFGPGPESLEVELFDEDKIPWDEIAFSSVKFSLENFFRDRAAGEPGLHLGGYTGQIPPKNG